MSEEYSVDLSLVGVLSIADLAGLLEDARRRYRVRLSRVDVAPLATGGQSTPAPTPRSLWSLFEDEAAPVAFIGPR